MFPDVNCDIIDYRNSDFLTKSDFIVNLPNQYPYHIPPHPSQHLSIGNETCKRQDTIHMLEIDQNCEPQNLGKTTANQVAMKGTCGRGKSNKCNQCGNEFSNGSNLRKHMKIHTEDKTNKCNQCDYALHPMMQAI